MLGRVGSVHSATEEDAYISDDEPASNSVSRSNSRQNDDGRAHYRSPSRDDNAPQSQEKTKNFKKRSLRDKERQVRLRQSGHQHSDEDDSLLQPGSSRNTEASYVKDSGYSDVVVNSPPEMLAERRLRQPLRGVKYDEVEERNSDEVEEFPPLREKPGLISPDLPLEKSTGSTGYKS